MPDDDQVQDDEPPSATPWHGTNGDPLCLNCGHEFSSHYLADSGRPRCGRRINAFGPRARSICGCKSWKSQVPGQQKLTKLRYSDTTPV